MWTCLFVFFFQKTSLLTVGGGSIPDAAKRCIERVLHNDVQFLCNWDGRKGSKAPAEQEAKFAFGYTLMHPNDKWWQ